MDINFLPDSPHAKPPLVVSLEELQFVPGGVAERIVWAQEAGFSGVEILATGEPTSGVHVPSVDAEDRAHLREVLQNGRLVVQAPHQQTWDVTLVSPSSAIRRASLTELWAVCRFAGVVAGENAPLPVVLVRTGTPPLGIGSVRVREYLRESLQVLDRTAGEQNVRIGLLNRDVMETMDDKESLLGDLHHTGLALDIPHALLDQSTTLAYVAALLRQFAGRFEYVRVPFANGHDRAFLADTLKQTGYAHAISLALSPTAFQNDAAAHVGQWNRALLHGDGETA